MEHRERVLWSGVLPSDCGLLTLWQHDNNSHNPATLRQHALKALAACPPQPSTSINMKNAPAWAHPFRGGRAWMAGLDAST